MRILQVHNRYLQYGGEDKVADEEFRILREAGVVVQQLHFSNEQVNPSSVFYNRRSAALLKKEIRSFKPDVIHVHNFFYNASPSVFYEAKRNGIPVVLTIHNFRLICPGALLLRDGKVCDKCIGLSFPVHAVRHKCFKESASKTFMLASSLFLHNTLKTWEQKIDTVVVLTPWIKKLFLSSRLEWNTGQIVVKPNSTADIYAPEAERSGFVFVGRLSAEKGVAIAIDAFRELPDEQLHVIGDGDLKEVLQARASNNITFYGKRDAAFVKRMLNGCKGLIFPSVWYEGLPNTIMEAFSAGIPVIGSDIDNINTIVEDGFNGLLFKPFCSESLVEVISNTGDGTLAQLGDNARTTYLEKYQHSINKERLLSIYTRLMK